MLIISNKIKYKKATIDKLGRVQVLLDWDGLKVIIVSLYSSKGFNDKPDGFLLLDKRDLKKKKKITRDIKKIKVWNEKNINYIIDIINRN